MIGSRVDPKSHFKNTFIKDIKEKSRRTSWEKQGIKMCRQSYTVLVYRNMDKDVEMGN